MNVTDKFKITTLQLGAEIIPAFTGMELTVEQATQIFGIRGEAGVRINKHGFFTMARFCEDGIGVFIDTDLKVGTDCEEADCDQCAKPTPPTAAAPRRYCIRLYDLGRPAKATCQAYSPTVTTLQATVRDAAKQLKLYTDRQAAITLDELRSDTGWTPIKYFDVNGIEVDGPLGSAKPGQKLMLKAAIGVRGAHPYQAVTSDLPAGFEFTTLATAQDQPGYITFVADGRYRTVATNICEPQEWPEPDVDVRQAMNDAALAQSGRDHRDSVDARFIEAAKQEVAAVMPPQPPSQRFFIRERRSIFGSEFYPPLPLTSKLGNHYWVSLQSRPTLARAVDVAAMYHESRELEIMSSELTADGNWQPVARYTRDGQLKMLDNPVEALVETEASPIDAYTAYTKAREAKDGRGDNYNLYHESSLLHMILTGETTVDQARLEWAKANS